MHLPENENIENRMNALEKRFDKIEELIYNLSCRINDLEDLNDEPPHTEGWYMT